MTTSALSFADLLPLVFLLHLFHFIRRFWNHILTCVSVSMRLVASSYRCGRVKYFWAWKWRSRVSSCWLENAVRGRRCLPFMVKFLAWKKGWEQSVQWKRYYIIKCVFTISFGEQVNGDFRTTWPAWFVKELKLSPNYMSWTTWEILARLLIINHFAVKRQSF